MRNLKLFKIDLRKKYRAIRENMNPKEKKFMDERILHKLSSLSEYKRNRDILVYVSKKIEVSTYEIMCDAWKKGKRVAVPRCNTDDRSMDFYYIRSMEDLEKGAFGLYEPIKEKCEIYKTFLGGLCIVPGFCFDQNGYRLGYGHGYYDRFLQKFRGIKVGICYSNCMKFYLPKGKYDRPVDILVNDKYIKRIHTYGEGPYRLRNRIPKFRRY